MNNPTDIDTVVKKVFKSEFAILAKSRSIVERPELSLNEVQQEYKRLLEAYELLLNNAVKITKIGDINQKKLYESHQEIERQKKILYEASITDYLTKIHNRAYLMDIFSTEYAKSKRYDFVFSCILIDVDDFKKINDRFGHLAGDSVLKETTAIIKQNVREVDVFGRYGGEEFLIILPNTKVHEAEQVAEKIRKKVANYKFNIAGKEFFITLSMGLSDSVAGNPKNEDEFINNIDSALYQAKEQGKNCHVLFQA